MLQPTTVFIFSILDLMIYYVAQYHQDMYSLRPCNKYNQSQVVWRVISIMIIITIITIIIIIIIIRHHQAEAIFPGLPFSSHVGGRPSDPLDG